MASVTLNAGTAWSACESVIRGFESAWRGGGRPRLEAYLPADAPTDLLVELVHVDLEFRLRAGEDARAEDYLGRFPALADKGLTLDLIAAEFALRRRHRRPARADEFVDRFPALETDLRALLTADGRPPGDSRTRPAGPAPAVPVGVPDIPGYEVFGEVGRGGMGVVFTARDRVLNRTVAVKTFGAVPGAEAAARFAREAEAVARLDHPHIVPVYEVGEWAAGGAAMPYFVMKWLPGGSLDRAPAGPGTDPRGHARAVATVARAVHHAHQRGVLHRDLKPSNILLDDGGGPHVADFGLAGRFDPSGGGSDTRTGAVVGTPAYMAPEQATAPKLVTTAADVYGLGAVLYHRLTGRPPFAGPTALATLHLVTTTPPARPRALNPAVPRDLETVCLKCLEKEPGRRYGSAAELADDLDRWAGGRPVHARPAKLWEHGWRWGRRHPFAAGMGAVAVTAVGFAVCTASASYDRIQAEKEAATETSVREHLERCRLQTALRHERQALYLERVASAGRLVAAGRGADAGRLLDRCPPAARGWEWQYLDAVRRGGPAVREVPPPTEPTADVEATSPDGLWRAVAADGVVDVRDAASGVTVRRLDAGGRVTAVAFRPAGDRLATGGADGTVRVWDVESGHELLSLPGVRGPVVGLGWERAGDRLVARDAAGVRGWDGDAGR